MATKKTNKKNNVNLHERVAILEEKVKNLEEIKKKFINLFWGAVGALILLLLKEYLWPIVVELIS